MLRSYQQVAIDAIYRHLRERDDNPVVVLPTGAGKSWVIAQLAADATQLWNERVLILAHRRELLEQNADKLQRMDSSLDVGLFSAGLGKRDCQNAVIVAGIHSIWKKASDFEPFDLVVVDECHLIGTDEDGMFRQFLSEAKEVNPALRIVGLTATPFRLKSGSICTPDGILNRVCYEVGVRELIVGGYLCPLVSKAGKSKVDTNSLNIRAGEYIGSEVEELMDREAVVESACAEIVEMTRGRHSVLIFASGVKHAEHVVRVFEEQHGLECGFVCGETPAGQREELLARFRRDATSDLFKREPLNYLVSVDLLTVGFDCPRVDCVAMLRPTMSPGLLCQMVGRGFRLHPEKQDCLVLDYGGNILRHGPIDQIRLRTQTDKQHNGPRAKECPECQMLLALGYSVCPECGYKFTDGKRDPSVSHDPTASSTGVLSGQHVDTEFVVQDVHYNVHFKRDAPEDAPRTMRVQYRLSLNHWQSEFICFEHKGYARGKAVAWWKARSNDPVPATAEIGVMLAEAGALCFTEKITVRSTPGEKYDRIVGYQLGPKPELVDAIDFDRSVFPNEPEFEEVPF